LLLANPRGRWYGTTDYMMPSRDLINKLNALLPKEEPPAPKAKRVAGRGA
jgi:hypothetical protein